MKTCTVPLCENDTQKRPDLKYFLLPKNADIRDEWLDAIGIKKRGGFRGQNISICELHFRDLDFAAGKKELKVHAVPVLNLGNGIVDQMDEDEEFLNQSISASEEAEIDSEVKQKVATPGSDKKKLLVEASNIKQEKEDQIEPESGRRPSRRAAVVAARKISNTVRHYGVKDDPDDPNSTPTPSKRFKTEFARNKKFSIDLEMTCVDEPLTSVQIAYHKKIETEYNLAVKNLRDLAKCSNVRIIQEGGRPIDLRPPALLVKNGGGMKIHKVKPPPRINRPVPIVEYSEPPKLKVIYI